MTENATTPSEITEDPSLIDRVIEINEGGQTFRGLVSSIEIAGGRYLVISVKELMFQTEDQTRRWRRRGSGRAPYEGRLGSVTLTPGPNGSIKISVDPVWRAVILPEGTPHLE